MPERIQLSRAKGWRLPANTVVVSRPSKWGNPFNVTDIGRAFPSLTSDQCHNIAVRNFESLVNGETETVMSVLQPDGTRRRVAYTYPSIAEIRTGLAGFDLACWCSPDQACHADSLLEIANPGSAA